MGSGGLADSHTDMYSSLSLVLCAASHISLYLFEISLVNDVNCISQFLWGIFITRGHNIIVLLLLLLILPHIQK